MAWPGKTVGPGLLMETGPHQEGRWRSKRRLKLRYPATPGLTTRPNCPETLLFSSRDVPGIPSMKHVSILCDSAGVPLSSNTQPEGGARALSETAPPRGRYNVQVVSISIKRGLDTRMVVGTKSLAIQKARGRPDRFGEAVPGPMMS